MRSLWTTVPVVLLLLSACGGDGGGGSNDGGGNAQPFEGRDVTFKSTYASFPSSFGFRLVKDTYAFSRDEACAKIKLYNNLVPLPAPERHLALFIDIQTASKDDITVVAGDPGVPGDLRVASIAEYQDGDQKPRTGAYALAASGVIRVTTFEAQKRVAGTYNLQFPSGEKLSGDFDVAACP